MHDFITSHRWYGLLTIALLLAGWQIAAAVLKLPLILPSPAATWSEITTLVTRTVFWRHLWATLSRGLTGFGMALLLGLLCGLSAGKHESGRVFLRPLIVLIRSTPVMSIIILALIWFQNEYAPVFVTCLMVFPIIAQNIIEGISQIDDSLKTVFTVYRIASWRRITQLELPSLLPFLAAGISNGLGITWKVLIAVEVLAYPRWGIGTQLDYARIYLRTETVFAWTLVVIGLGLFFDYVLDYLLKRPFRAWKRDSHD